MRAILLLLSLLFFHYGFSQDTLTVGVIFNSQRTWIYNSFEKSGVDLIGTSSGFVKTIYKYPSYNNGLSLLLKRRVAKNLRVCYGVQYVPMEQSYGLVDGDDLVNPGKIRLRYASIPLTFQFDFWQLRKAKFYVAGGLQASVLVFETGAIPYYYHNLNTVDAGGAYKNLSFDAVSYAGVSIRLSEKYEFEILTRLILGITDPEDKDFEIVYSEKAIEVFKPRDESKRPMTRNIALGGGLGITRKLR